jgi:hypothetical protein
LARAVILVLTRRKKGGTGGGGFGNGDIEEGGPEGIILCFTLTRTTFKFAVPPAVALLDFRIFSKTGIFRGFSLKREVEKGGRTTPRFACE